MFSGLIICCLPLGLWSILNWFTSVSNYLQLSCGLKPSTLIAIHKMTFYIYSLTSFILVQLFIIVGGFFYFDLCFFSPMQNRKEEDRNIHQCLRLTAHFQRTGHDATEKQWILWRYWFPAERVMFSQLDVALILRGEEAGSKQPA